MSKENMMQKLVEEIGLFIKYAVPEDEQQRAVSLVEKYDQNRPVLTLLREYYSTLPEAREEGVSRIVSLASMQGVSLFIVITKSNQYLYVASEDKVVFLGEYGSEVDEQILSYLGYESQTAFLKACLPVEQLEDYAGEPAGGVCSCSACGVVEGEVHMLGCAVEVCPWCDGQLSNCNCRFEQLELDEIENEEQLDEFYDLLREKGRIPFQKDQSPLYPGAGEGPDKN
jgi:hypothetical protein